MAVAAGIGAFLASEAGQAVLSSALSVGKSYLENRMNQKNAQDQRDWQEEMWNKQNAYNSPVMMAFRMRQAGLNPYAMTGAEPAGSAGTGAMAQTSPIASPLDVISQLASIRNINADTSKKTEEAESTRLSNMKLAVEANNFEEYYRLYLQGMENSNNLTHEQAEKTRAEALKAFEEARQLKEFGDSGGNVFVDASNLSQSQTALNEAMTEYRNILNSNADAQQKAEIKQKLASAQKSYAEALAAQMQAKYTETLNHNATKQEARNAALQIYQESLLRNQANIAYQESVVRHMEAMRAEAKTKNPFTDTSPQGFFAFVYYNLFGEDGVMGF